MARLPLTASGQRILRGKRANERRGFYEKSKHCSNHDGRGIGFWVAYP